VIAPDIAAPVFVLELPLGLAPTMNVWSSMKGWSKAKMRKAIDLVIVAKLSELADRGGVSSLSNVSARGRVRRVVVDRHSSREPDELACDTIGAKPVIDRLVLAGILAGDSRKFLQRNAWWSKAKAGQGFLRIEVFDV
jgi:hypothetical protein